jgi:hypothetical protein
VTVLPKDPAELATLDCQLCGACCSFSAEWPRFSLESDAYLNQIPRAYVDDQQGRMRCGGNRCAALVGDVGVSTACAIYTVRPDVCKACLPGDDACQLARRRFNLAGQPADIPVQAPARLQTILNLKAANVLGIVVPSSMPSIADEAIE